MATEHPIRPILITLLANGIGVENVEPAANGYVLSCSTRDRFGGELRYVVVFSEDLSSQAAIDLGKQRARVERAQLVCVGHATPLAEGLPSLTESEFLARFGGPIDSLLPLEDAYGDDLRELGQNRLPNGKQGVAADLFEDYVAAGLQFLIGRRVLRYGRKRSGERVPDGIALTGMTYVLFDAKAAQGGFHFDAETVRQFASYTKDFMERYSNLGTPHAFLCVSGSFEGAASALDRRSQALYAEARILLVTMTADELAKAVEFFRDNLHLRQFLDWRRLLAAPVLVCAQIEAAARATERDGLTGGVE